LAAAMFTIENVPADGYYALALTFQNGNPEAGGNDAKLAMIVNGVYVKDTFLPAQDNWGIEATQTEIVYLKAGTNTVRYWRFDMTLEDPLRPDDGGNKAAPNLVSLNITPASHEHTAGETVIENKIDATCDQAGSYDNVVYCSGCGEEMSRNTVTIPATGAHGYFFTDNGNNTHTYACSECGNPELAGVEEHFYDENNSCACGHTLIDLIKSSQATLEAMLRLDFTVDKSLLTGEDNYVVLTHTYADGSTDVVTIPQNEWHVSGMVSYSKIAAKEMGDNVTIVVYNAQGQQLSIPESDSIKAYAFRGLKALAGVSATSKNGILRTLLVDMLNYGAAAQVQFKYDTGNLVNADLTDAQKAWASVADITPTNNQIKDAATFNTTLVLESAIEMDCIFYTSKIGAASTWKDLYAIATYTDFNGNPKTVRIEGESFSMYNSSSYALVPVIGMAVADYQSIVTCVVYDANGNVLATAVDSMESYAYRALASGAAGETLENLCKLLMKFSASADAYFAK